MNNFDLQDNKLQISDPVETYFECISSCDVTDGICVSKCVEKLRDEQN